MTTKQQGYRGLKSLKGLKSFNIRHPTSNIQHHYFPYFTNIRIRYKTM